MKTQDAESDRVLLYEHIIACEDGLTFYSCRQDDAVAIPSFVSHLELRCPQKLLVGPKVVPFCGLYLGSYKAIPKRNYLGAYG